MRRTKRILAALLLAALCLPAGCKKADPEIGRTYRGTINATPWLDTYDNAMDSFVVNGGTEPRLCRLRITALLSKPQAEEKYLPEDQKGLPSSDRSREYYAAEIVYDYLTDKASHEEIVYLSTLGVEWQKKNRPPYEIGSELLILLVPGRNGSYKTFAEGLLCFDIYNEEGTEYAYRRNISSPELEHLEAEMTPEQKTRVTTTAENPVVYGAKYKLDGLIEYIVADWKERGLA